MKYILKYILWFHKGKNHNKIFNYLCRLMHHLPTGSILRNASLDDSVTV